MMTAYDEIELYGLTENGTDDLPIPNDDELQGRVVREAFDALIGPCRAPASAPRSSPLPMPSPRCSSAGPQCSTRPPTASS